MIENRTVAERDNLLMFAPSPRFLYLPPVLDACYGGLSKPGQKSWKASTDNIDIALAYLQIQCRKKALRHDTLAMGRKIFDTS